MNQEVLSQTYVTTTQLQAVGEHQVELSLRLTIVFIDAEIDAEIDRSAHLTEVSIRAIGSPLEETEFKFLVTEFVAVEQAIAPHIYLTRLDEVRNLLLHF